MVNVPQLHNAKTPLAQSSPAAALPANNWIFKKPEMTDREAFERYYLGTPAQRRRAEAVRKRVAKTKAKKERLAEAAAKKRHVAEWKAEVQERHEAKKRRLAEATAA
jgi:hypothetical protein